MDPKVARLITWAGGALPELGHYLQTSSGSTYLIIDVRLNTRLNPKSIVKLDLLKFTSEEKEEIPKDAIIHQFHWSSRERA